MTRNDSNKETILGCESELKALSATLNKLDDDFKKALIDEPFYYRKRQALVAENEVNLKELKKILLDIGATSVTSVILKATEAKPKEDKIKDELIKVAQEAEDKGWGTKLVEQIKEHSGDIADLAIKIGLRIGKSMIDVL